MPKLAMSIGSKHSLTLVSKAGSLQFIMGCLLVTCMITGCQKPDKLVDEANDSVSQKAPESSIDNDVETNTSNKDVHNKLADMPININNNLGNDEDIKKGYKPDIKSETYPQDIKVLDADAPMQPLNAKASAALLEKQVTTVDYRSTGGQTLKVTYQTSALEALEADVKLPSGSRVILMAPEGQGNNPTYRSADGSIELVTHGGGGSIDLIFNGNQTEFDAINADAKVVSLS